MSLQDKIDQIRRKPEHIRLRWALVLASVFTLFIVIIWIFSIKAQSQEEKTPEITEEQKSIMDEFGQQKKSLKDAAGDIKNTLGNPVLNNQEKAQ